MNADRPKTPDPAPAATVVLVREQKSHLQVLLVRRSAESRFMGGRYVFPGGRLEPADADVDGWQRHLDLTLDQIMERFGDDMPTDKYIAYAIAAIRETFEEAGVLFAQPVGRCGQVLQTVCDRRLAGRLPPNWLRRLVQHDNWIIALSRLYPWSHWITPEQMRHRYDTRFFAARLPDGQVCAADMRETVSALWVRPAEALRANLSGEVPLSPPTLLTLHELLAFSGVQDFIDAAATRRWAPPLKPRLVAEAGEMLIVEPWDPEYRQSQIRIDVAALRTGIAPVGASFSRLWLSDGIWKPVVC